uniref:peptide-methionine (S)-S-oxide reductase n=3 Tax=Lygus hesperus TaxID=30085 RepID=A0A0K8SDD2_LYGHE
MGAENSRTSPEKSRHPVKTLPNALHHVDVPTKKATFAMACFWAPDALFGATPGVIKTRVGYCGGAKNNPTYRDLGDHTEAIDVDYDPNQITYEKLLELFWANHDPTARLKTQYTSFIFYHDEDQKAAAEKTMKEQEKTHKRPLVTVVRPAAKFWDAEDYHQKFRLQQHPWLCELLSVKDNGQLLKESFVSARLNGYVIGCGGVEQFEKEWATLGLDQKAANYVRRLVTKYEGQGLVC